MAVGKNKRLTKGGKKGAKKKVVDPFSKKEWNDVKEVVNKLIPDSIGKDIEKSCQGIYPLHDVLIHKVKVLKKPKFDVGKLTELHGDGGSSGGAKAVASEGGEKVDRVDGYE